MKDGITLHPEHGLNPSIEVCMICGEEMERESAFSVDMHQDMKSALTEVEVNETMLESGHMLKDITLPENTLVMMVCRNGEYFVPQGKTELLLGDKLLVISDRSEELATTYKDMGIDDVMKLG